MHHSCYSLHQVWISARLGQSDVKFVVSGDVKEYLTGMYDKLAEQLLHISKHSNLCSIAQPTSSNRLKQMNTVSITLYFRFHTLTLCIHLDTTGYVYSMA